MPERPKNDLEFKRAYARIAAAAGITRDQAVRIYSFETGGNGTYDVQAGLTHPGPKARAISTAMGYNQLLTTNSVSLMAGHGDQFLAALQGQAAALSGDRKQDVGQQDHHPAPHDRAQPQRAEPVERAREARQDHGGWGIHAAVLDRDIGPLLQTQKLRELRQSRPPQGLTSVR